MSEMIFYSLDALKEYLETVPDDVVVKVALEIDREHAPESDNAAAAYQTAENEITCGEG